jgi:hypothetical protein
VRGVRRDQPSPHEPVIEELVMAICEPGGEGATIDGPARFGKSDVLRAVTERVERRAGKEGWRVCVVVFDFSPFYVGDRRLDSANPEHDALASLSAYIRSAAAAPAYPDETHFDRAIGDALFALKQKNGQRVMLLLVLESLALLPRPICDRVEAKLRVSLDRYGKDDGLRLLLSSRLPIDYVLTNPAGSSVKIMLTKRRLAAVPLSYRDSFARDLDCVQFVAWLYEHTAGHPEYFTRLLRQLAEILQRGHRPSWSLDSASDEERLAALHDPRGDFAPATARLRECARATAEEFSGHLPALTAQRTPPLYPWLKEHDEDVAMLASGLFARAPDGQVRCIPFVLKVLAQCTQ